MLEELDFFIDTKIDENVIKIASEKSISLNFRYIT